MLSEKYRRLWKRRLRRRPLLPFLLAATIACVLGTLPVPVENPDGTEAGLVFVGGAVALFGLCGLWVSRRLSGLIGRLTVTSAVILLVSYALQPMISDFRGMMTFGLLVSSTAGVLGAVIRRLVRWKQHGLQKTRRRFSIGSLMALTTFVVGAIVLMQGVDLEVLLALATDPSIISLLVAEVATAPMLLAIALTIRSTKTAAIVMASAMVGLLVTNNLLVPATQMPVIWLPPYYYHVGLSLMTASWILGTRAQGPRDLIADLPEPIEETRDEPASPTPEVESIDLRG